MISVEEKEVKEKDLTSTLERLVAPAVRDC